MRRKTELFNRRLKVGARSPDQRSVGTVHFQDGRELFFGHADGSGNLRRTLTAQCKVGAQLGTDSRPRVPVHCYCEGLGAVFARRLGLLVGALFFQRL